MNARIESWSISPKRLYAMNMTGNELVDSFTLLVTATALVLAIATCSRWFWRRHHPDFGDRRWPTNRPAKAKRNRAVRLPAAADAGKIDPPLAEPTGIDPSIEVHRTLQQFSQDRRVTAAEFREIMPEPNALWTRIGFRRRGASIRSDDNSPDGSAPAE